MHEMSIAQSLLQTALQTGLAENAARIKKVSVSLGRFCGVEPQLLKDAFGILTAEPGTKFSAAACGAKLEISMEPFAIHCQSCRKDYERDEIDLVCPVCGGLFTRVISGQEIFLTGLEISK